MIATLQFTAETRRRIAADQAAADRFGAATVGGLTAGSAVGAEEVRRQLSAGSLGLRMIHPASGLAASVTGWMIDESLHMAAIGVPSNAPAASYASIHEFGGTILPKNGRSLAIPVSDEARKWGGPRQMEAEGGVDLDFIPRAGKPPLLVSKMHRRGRHAGFDLHWVLVSSVTIPARHWLSKGVDNAAPQIGAAFGDGFFSIFSGEV